MVHWSFHLTPERTLHVRSSWRTQLRWHDIAPLLPRARQQNPKQPIRMTEARATSSVALQHCDLMAQRDQFRWNF